MLKGQKVFLLGNEDELRKVEYGWLRREPTSPAEIRDLLGIVERSLADSKVKYETDRRGNPTLTCRGGRFWGAQLESSAFTLQLGLAMRASVAETR